MEETIFSKIIAKKIPAKIEYEDERYIVIHDIEPAAPVHLLVIPKKAIATLNDLTPADAELVGGMFLVARELMHKTGAPGLPHGVQLRCRGAAVGVSPAPARPRRTGVYLAAGMSADRRLRFRRSPERIKYPPFFPRSEARHNSGSDRASRQVVGAGHPPEMQRQEYSSAVRTSRFRTSQ